MTSKTNETAQAAMAEEPCERRYSREAVVEVSRGPDETMARRPGTARPPLEDSRHAGCEGPM